MVSQFSESGPTVDIDEVTGSNPVVPTEWSSDGSSGLHLSAGNLKIMEMQSVLHHVEIYVSNLDRSRLPFMEIDYGWTSKRASSAL